MIKVRKDGKFWSCCFPIDDINDIVSVVPK